MTNLTIQIPDDLARRLEGVASAHKKTVEQVALEVEVGPEEGRLVPRPGVGRHGEEL